MWISHCNVSFTLYHIKIVWKFLFFLLFLHLVFQVENPHRKTNFGSFKVRKTELDSCET